MDDLDVVIVHEAYLSCCDASGNGKEAHARAQQGDKEGCIERLEWMLGNLATTKFKLMTALDALKGGV